MKKKSIIPDLPPSFVINQKAKAKLEKWIKLFKELSPRILVKISSENDFDLSIFELRVKKIIENSRGDDNAIIIDWPNHENVAFVVSFDSAFPGHKTKFLDKNTYMFCYCNVAFGLEYFEWDDENAYSLQSYTEQALSWKYIFEIIKGKLKEIEESITDL